jgi:hypothetical protein
MAEMSPTQKREKCVILEGELAELEEYPRSQGRVWSDEEVARGEAALRSVQTARERFGPGISAEDSRRAVDHARTVLDGLQQFYVEVGLPDELASLRKHRTEFDHEYAVLGRVVGELFDAVARAKEVRARIPENQQMIDAKKAELQKMNCDGAALGRWVRQGVSDCGGNDVGSSQGVDPQPGMCSGAAVTAVCWDGASYTNANEGRAWCTYKRTPASQCTGGGAPGVIYRCEPAG